MSQHINGELWLDTEGNPIHAHGGHMLRHGDYVYWYGEDRRGDIYVSCYRSKNFTDWEFRRHILTKRSPAAPYYVRTDLSLEAREGIPNPSTAINVGNAADRKVNIERPKVLYCAETGKFVLWAHWENGVNYRDARICIADCDTPDGEFVYRGSFNPYGYMSRDCTLFTDDDGRSYFISAARDNADLIIYRLSRDCMTVEKVVNVLWQGQYREAPQLFKRNGRYWLLTSECTGWAPNQGGYSCADSLDGEWEPIRPFGDSATYRSQGAFIVTPGIRGCGRGCECGLCDDYVYFGDRWGGKGDAYFTSGYVALRLAFGGDGKSLTMDWDEKPAL